MSDQPTEDTPSLFHVERQEVFYETTVIDAVDADTARMIVIEEDQGMVIGRRLVSRLFTTVHPATDKCTDGNCHVLDNGQPPVLP